jgi:oligopeptide/dipeptide ABC transporter ATP-binding protein
MSSDSIALLDAKRVVKRFEIKLSPFKKGYVHALNKVDLVMSKGKTLSLVGESGCGKTTMGKAVLGLNPPDEGNIHFKGKEIGAMRPRQRREIQKDIQMIFQDPYASLNPRKKIYQILERPLKTYTQLSKEDRLKKIMETCKSVGVGQSYLQRYPHQFSGGQRQRIAIARAIILDPALVIADEPISALDVSIQSQILNLLMDIQEQRGLTYLFITHDISVVKHISDEIAVMYLGQIVERATKASLFDTPLHPYTRMLFSAVPDMSRPFLDQEQITGEVPNPTNLPSGCFFHPRCPIKQANCEFERPTLDDAGGDHLVRCFYFRKYLKQS